MLHQLPHWLQLINLFFSFASSVFLLQHIFFNDDVTADAVAASASFIYCHRSMFLNKDDLAVHWSDARAMLLDMLSTRNGLEEDSGFWEREDSGDYHNEASMTQCWYMGILMWCRVFLLKGVWFDGWHQLLHNEVFFNNDSNQKITFSSMDRGKNNPFMWEHIFPLLLLLLVLVFDKEHILTSHFVKVVCWHPMTILHSQICISKMWFSVLYVLIKIL